MEITTTHPKQTALAKQVSLSDQKKNVMPKNDRGSEKTAQATADSVQLSNESLQLSLSSSLQERSSVKPIENGEQAQQAAEQVVSEFRNNPSLAQQIFGKPSQDNFKLLLE